MKYTYVIDELFNLGTVLTENKAIPLNPKNMDYQKMLDDINEQGADCWNGDIPEDLQVAANQKQFNQQLADYSAALARLQQYILSEGRPELRQDVVVETKEVFNEVTGTVETIETTENVLIQTAIEPLEETITVSEMNEFGVVETKTVRNPQIVKDEEERAEAQTVINNTPEMVKLAI